MVESVVNLNLLHNMRRLFLQYVSLLIILLGIVSERNAHDSFLLVISRKVDFLIRIVDGYSEMVSE